MLTSLKGLTRRLLRSFGHPSYTELVDWLAGELDGPVLGSTTRHVLSCHACQRETKRIKSVLERSSAVLDWEAAPPPPQRAAGRLPGLLRNAAVIRIAEERHRQERALRLAAALRPYLGQRPMSLLEHLGSSGFLPEVGRLAGVFLGRQAAAALIDTPDWQDAGSEGMS